MGILSVSFLAFFVVSLGIYYLIPRRWQWVVLLCTSILYYLLYATPYTGIYLLISIVSVYGATRLIETKKLQAAQCRAQKDKAAAAKLEKRAKQIYLLCLLLNLGILACLKYANFILLNVGRCANFLGANLSVTTLQWVSSLGVSFYTLQIVGYLTDVYWGISPAQKSIGKLALFSGYFPQLISGPISKYSFMEKTLYCEHAFDWQAVTHGLERMLWGFFKKLVLAERLGPVVAKAYSRAYEATSPEIWIATAACVLWIYMDFSGNMDIIMGVSECYGVILPANFRTPFFSRTIQEFWQRWHITLGAWLKDYIMYPLLKSRLWSKLGKRIKKAWNAKVAQMVTTFAGMLVLWLAMGLWHGGGWNYIIEGIWFWLVIVCGKLAEPLFHRTISTLHIRTEAFSWHLFQSVRTTLIYAVGALFFMANSASEAFQLLKTALFSFDPSYFFTPEAIHFWGGAQNFVILLAGVLLVLLVSSLQAQGLSLRKWLSAQNLVFKTGVVLAGVFVVLLLGMYGPGYNPADFIYEGF